MGHAHFGGGSAEVGDMNTASLKSRLELGNYCGPRSYSMPLQFPISKR